MTITDTERSSLHHTYAWSVNAAIGSGRDELAHEMADEFTQRTEGVAPPATPVASRRATRRHRLRRPLSRRAPGR